MISLRLKDLNLLLLLLVYVASVSLIGHLKCINGTLKHILKSITVNKHTRDKEVVGLTHPG